MINFDNYANENNAEHNLKWPYILDHPYRILMIRGSGSGKANSLLNLLNNHPDIDKIYLYTKDSYEAKYRFLVNKRESTGLMILKFLLSIEMICKMFTKILKNATQINNDIY